MQDAIEFLRESWPLLVGTAGVAGVALSLVAVGHVILNKRDVRAAIGWTGLILFSPLFGAFAYYLLGINRIQRRASKVIPGNRDPEAEESATVPLRRLTERYGERAGNLGETVGEITGSRLLDGNAVRALVNGDDAYPAMLSAIAGAHRSVIMSSYIFDDDRAGRRFVETLAEAVKRGVEVRVLIDAVGVRYSRPPVTRALSRVGVTSALFLRARVPWRHPYMNLRNHRKLMVIDGSVGFVGGMNIREGCSLGEPSKEPVRDIHFRVEGPVVDQMFQAVAGDWTFTTGEALEGPAWESATAKAGSVLARGIDDGPDEHFETIRWTMMSALTAARKSVHIVTPYFLPDTAMIAALKVTALRGIEVDIVLPRKNNLRFVQWASTAQLWQVIRPGCRVWLTPGPFDHSKMMIVDDTWCLVGSANWDPRSLRLNFEYNLECYDRDLAASLQRLTREKLQGAERVTLEMVDGRSLPKRLRDGITRLFLPYL